MEALMERLPNTPSKLIRIAIADLADVERDPKYRVKMGLWHKPEGGVCTVCLAGAVMAKTLRVGPASEMIPSRLLKDEEHKLLALDSFRAGNIETGLIHLGFSLPDGIPSDIPVTSYHVNPEKCKTDLLGVASLLENYRL